MLVKVSIAATALVCAVVALSSINFRQLYNGMYPVNGLRRDVLNLCHEAEPTFVRAIRASRDNCYDAMPDPVELAIGWVRSSSRLAAMRRPPSPAELAERRLVEAATQGRFDLLGPRRFTGYATMPAALRPCEDPATGLAATALVPMNDPLANDRLARHIAGGGDAALAALGLAMRDAQAGSPRGPELPVLPLGGAAGSSSPDGAPAPARTASARAASGAALFDPMPAAGLGDSSALSLAPRAAAPGCKTPA
jgi:hypothetical protein